MQKPDQTVFYGIEKAIKSYRQFAQKNITDKGFAITIDQGLILSLIQDYPGITQQQIAIRAFKDHASVTRIIENLVSRKLLTRDFHPDDRRRFSLGLSTLGSETLHQLKPVASANRKKALKGVSVQELETLKNILDQITENCTDHEKQ
ncbi:MAG: MarR family transcriptional regulator [Chitinophagaceae bacterium]